MSKIDELTKEINATLATMLDGAVRHAIHVGVLLIKVKAGIEHGKFEKYLKENVPGLSAKTAQRYMKYAKHQSDIETFRRVKNVKLSDLSLGEIDRLLSKPKRAGGKSDAQKAADSVNRAVELLKELRIADPTAAENLARLAVDQLSVLSEASLMPTSAKPD
jgi:hypothetical protein